jgi:uncharacterized membrane protein
MSPRRPLPAVTLVLLATAVVTLVEIGVLDYAYARIGVPHRWFGALLVASVLGSSVDLPLGQRAVGRTQLACNVGGALVPVVLACWVLTATGAWLPGLAASAIVAVVTHRLARAIPGFGIALPPLVPAPVAALVAVALAPDVAPAVAYAAGTLGTLVGADLLNLGRITRMGAAQASIGGAGTFDGIFVTGLLAVLLA